MTIESGVNDGIVHSGNASATSFSFPFKVNKSSQVEVIHRDSAGTETVLTETTDYTVTNPTIEGSGSITYPVSGSPLPVGEKLAINPKMDYKQETDIRNQGRFAPEIHEDAFDTLMMHIKELKGSFNRAITFKKSSGKSSAQFSDDPVSGRSLVWDGTTGKIKNSTTDLDDVVTTAQSSATAAAASAASAADDEALAAASAAAVAAKNDQFCGTAGGTANALTLTVPTPSAYAAGLSYEFIPSLANGAGNVSVTPTGQTLGALKKMIGGDVVDLAPGDLRPGAIARITADNSVGWILLNPATNATGASRASAATLNLKPSTGDYLEITGTTTISSITLPDGAERKLRFASALTIVNGASLILPGGANITTAAGDVAVLRGEASGVVRCISYHRAAKYKEEPTFAAYTSGSGTYTVPAGVTWIRVKLVGGGGGGMGSGTGGGNGGAGGNTTFGTAFLAANGGGGGSAGAFTAGGTASGGYVNFTGGSGGGSSGGTNTPGGMGGGSVLGEGAPFGSPGNSGVAAIANSGGGGGGASSTATANSGAGGGGGGYCERLIYSPATSYAYSIGTAGTAGTAGTGGAAGGAGGSGVILIEEFYT